MWDRSFEWLRDLTRNARRQSMVSQLDRLSDHLLADMGLRRDQLDLLRLPPAGITKKVAAKAGHLVRPSLQGCG